MIATNKASRNRDFRILLVDDNQDANESMCSLLALIGYDVRTARDGASGLQVAQAFLPHLVLCDIGLPDMSGYQLAPEFRRAAGERHLVLAAATGYGFPSDMVQVFEAGFDFHFVKPLDADMLLDFVATQSELVMRANKTDSASQDSAG